MRRGAKHLHRRRGYPAPQDARGLRGPPRGSRPARQPAYSEDLRVAIGHFRRAGLTGQRRSLHPWPLRHARRTWGMSACHDTEEAPHPHHAFTLALVGNPNAGKTTLFNALTGLRAKTANFPGTTVERKVGRLHLDHKQIVVIDLPGLYSLDSTSPDEKLAADALQGKLEHTAPDAALVVVDATNL